MEEQTNQHIAIIGSGTIGLSFAALHLQLPSNTITIYDTRPDIASYIDTTLPNYLPTGTPLPKSRVNIAKSLAEAVSKATIVQEAGPENLSFKASLWPDVERHCPPGALLWSSTSGILASAQAVDMQDPSRLLVVHPYNPPHVMPLLEIVPSPTTSQGCIEAAMAYWRRLGREPVLVRKECTGFVANRLAFALLREAVHLVNEGVVGMEDVDRIVQASMGPRWAVAGPSKSYHAGGGKRGLEGFFGNIGGTVENCWKAQGDVHVGDGWEKSLFKQTAEAYGDVDVAQRDRITRKVLQVIDEEKRRA